METKNCNKCKRDRAMDCFYRNNQRADGRTGVCRDCMTVMRKAWDKRYNQTPKARAASKRYYHSEKGQAAKRAYRKTYTMTDAQREKYRVAGRAHEKDPRYKARRKRYEASPKGKAMKARLDKRYARTDKGRFSKRKVEIKRKHQIKSANCTITRDQWLAIKAAFKNRCAYCHQTFQRLEMDHVIPLSKLGPHSAENIVPACRKCNASKGNRLFPSAINAASGG